MIEGARLSGSTWSAPRNFSRADLVLLGGAAMFGSGESVFLFLFFARKKKKETNTRREKRGSWMREVESSNGEAWLFETGREKCGRGSRCTSASSDCRSVGWGNDTA